MRVSGKGWPGLSAGAARPGTRLTRPSEGRPAAADRYGHSAGISAWQWAHVVGGSASARVPQAGHTRRNQQAGSPGRSSISEAGVPAAL
jgi:hypothetical protein